MTVRFEKATYEALKELARAERLPLEQAVPRLVRSALALAEDLALLEMADGCLRALLGDPRIRRESLLRWNRRMRKRARRMEIV
jgi:hypothetical protein